MAEVSASTDIREPVLENGLDLHIDKNDNALPRSLMWPPSLPNEVICNIFFLLSALDLASLSQVCTEFHDTIANDNQLWKRVYLSTFDPPLRLPESWPTAVKNLIKTQKFLSTMDFELLAENREFVSSQILPLLLSTTSSRPERNISFLRPHFFHSMRRTTASTLLRASSLFRRCGTEFDLCADSVYLRQLSARLHVYSGLPLEIREPEKISMTDAHYIHPYARARIYDLRRYKTENGWGPFMDDGSWRVDWEKVQAIWLVLGYGMRMMAERHNGNILHVLARCMGMGTSDDLMWQGLASNSYRALGMIDGQLEHEENESTTATAGDSETGEEPDPSASHEDGVPPIEYFEKKYGYNIKEAQAQRQQALFALEDPYGVTGTWIRVVNFLDYHDLFALNFRDPPDLPDHVERGPVTTAEAFRLIMLELWITKIEWYDDEEEMVPRENDWETVAGSNASDSSTPAAEPDDLDAETAVDETPPDVTVHQSPGRAERIGSTSSDGLYHKPAHGDTGKTAERETPLERKRLKWPKVYFEGRSSSLQIRWDVSANSQIRGSNPFYDILGYVQARPSHPIPAKELRNDEGSDLSHIYPSLTQAAAAPTSAEPFVRLHPDDDPVIRWTSFSIFGGEARWRSEGVQIGGFKSARGILGNWFDKDYDRHGPAGPTGFWKIGDTFERYKEAA